MMTDSGEYFVKFKGLEKVTQTALEVIASYDGKMIDKLNVLDKVFINVDDKPTPMGPIDAIQYSQTMGGDFSEKCVVLQLAASSLLNAVSAWDDVHDWRDINYTEMGNEGQGQNHAAAVKTNMLEKALNEYSIKTGKSKKGIINFLKNSI
jgi:hypothetical protein